MQPIRNSIATLENRIWILKHTCCAMPIMKRIMLNVRISWTNVKQKISTRFTRLLRRYGHFRPYLSESCGNTTDPTPIPMTYRLWLNSAKPSFLHTKSHWKENHFHQFFIRHNPLIHRAYPYMENSNLVLYPPPLIWNLTDFLTDILDKQTHYIDKLTVKRIPFSVDAN